METSTKSDLAAGELLAEVRVQPWPDDAPVADISAAEGAPPHASETSQTPSSRDALQALLAFSALHQQVRRRRSLASRGKVFDVTQSYEFAPSEQFLLDEVLHFVAERGVAITGADGLAIALAENEEIVLRAAAGKVRPDLGQRIERDSAFSGACFRGAEIINCDDTEVDPRVNLQACRRLGARSMVAVPLCGRRRVIGVLEGFSTWPFAFNDTDIQNLTLLAELIVGALRPEDEDRFAAAAQVAALKLEPATVASPLATGSITPAVQSSAATQPATSPKSTHHSAAPKAEFAPPIASKPSTWPSTGQESAAVGTKMPEPETQLVALQPVPEPAAIDTHSSSAIALNQHAMVADSSPLEQVIAEPENERGHSAKLILVLLIVVGTAFAGGVWWKLKTAQLDGMLVQTKPQAVPARNPPAPTAAKSVSPPPATKSGAADDDSFEEVTDATPAAPPTAQEVSGFPHVTGIRHWSSADSSTVVLDLQDQVQYEAHRLSGPDRIYFDLHDTQLASELIGKSVDIGDSLLGRVRVAQPVTGMTRIVLETRNNSDFSVSLEPNPYRLVVEVRKPGAPPQAAVNLFPKAAEAEASKLAIVVPPPTPLDLQLRARLPKLRIAVDAGHGGWDLGTVGRRGLLEKDLVLEIAQRLGKLLESRLGAEVILTRSDDTYIPLDQRAEIANQAQADLFISVHANYSDLPSARGVETYYTTTFTTPNAKDADARAGAPKVSSLSSLTPADLHEKIEQSRRLAASVQHSLYGTLSTQNPGLRDRGVKEAGFVVLTESAMPGILAEVSFVSSPTDEQKLRSDGYREEIAEALYKGVARYAANVHAVKLASVGK
jgi:N-acetylmuramoyl-L-alanine amidase